MTREAALLVILAATAVIIGLGIWGWRRRAKRDSVALIAPGEFPASAVVTHAFTGFYVATTVHDAPLERVNAPGFAFRSRIGVEVSDHGVALDLTGRPRIVLAPDRLVDVAQSTVAIDRVVEKDGLTRLRWRTDAGDVVDTYLRPQDASARALAEAIRPLLPHTTTGLPTTGTGSDA